LGAFSGPKEKQNQEENVSPHFKVEENKKKNPPKKRVFVFSVPSQGALT
jgi:hypothetical protein